MNGVSKGYCFEIVFDENIAMRCGESVDDWYGDVADIVMPWGVQEISRGVWSPIRGVRADDLSTHSFALCALEKSKWFMERVKEVKIFEDGVQTSELLEVLHRHQFV
ncbi:hypothetical protein [Arcanobacterium hippocoleae]|uniref:Uncharacterized protein n=1 Tax=Arcanobacterium hippocoleae TaxID=149017 RepID=A0ABU1T2X6_9ACTO|nr:hypothetical protein [Arcanobacterium hippocoleae]MDR6939226.1 hypothetical protein [Arcanobacterium hippocoleae]